MTLENFNARHEVHMLLFESMMDVTQSILNLKNSSMSEDQFHRYDRIATKCEEIAYDILNEDNELRKQLIEKVEELQIRLQRMEES